MSLFLLDTNIISEPLKLQPNPTIISMLQRYQGEVTISSVTWHELLFGCYRLPASRKRERIEQYLQDIIEPNIPILPYNVAASEWFALARARLTLIGKPPAYADG
ncbi:MULTISPECIES: PIN domain-containing protein [unclassified Tolypothrix]|uniref:PIN domain-containing protein n=1 Tax=unclassified Tolypothrix TaxID=2649714 RepID=UPI0005EAC5AC|nr:MULTISPECIES: PIN domain-containing protein [unclassified Tolypothrix]EKE99783.1 putative PIN domain family RNase [Tolypothrix sp. PCC 7601]